VSRGLAIPGYLKKLGITHINEGTIDILGKVSFISMSIALLVGAAIILGSMWKASRASRVEYQVEEGYAKT
jgi:hypothetical protein